MCVLNHLSNPGDRHQAQASSPVGDFTCLWVTMVTAYVLLVYKISLWVPPEEGCLFFWISADDASIWKGLLLTWPSVSPGLSTEPWGYQVRRQERGKVTNISVQAQGIHRDSEVRPFPWNTISFILIFLSWFIFNKSVYIYVILILIFISAFCSNFSCLHLLPLTFLLWVDGIFFCWFESYFMISKQPLCPGPSFRPGDQE